MNKVLLKPFDEQGARTVLLSSYNPNLKVDRLLKSGLVMSVNSEHYHEKFFRFVVINPGNPRMIVCVYQDGTTVEEGPAPDLGPTV